MPGAVISVHIYSLQDGVTPERFRETVRAAAELGLFKLHGLASWWFGDRIKGPLGGHAASIWIYESRPAWEALWGTVEEPFPPEKYPPGWKIWEQEHLGPLLDRPADKIDFATYQTWLAAMNGEQPYG